MNRRGKAQEEGALTLLVTTNTGGIGGAGVTGADGTGSRGSRRRRGGTGAVGAEPHRDGVGRGTGRRRDAGSRDRSGRRRAGGRQGRRIVDVGDLLLAGVGKKTFKEEPGGEKTGRRWLGAVSGRDRGWVRVWNSLFHT